jgi:putative transposase
MRRSRFTEEQIIGVLRAQGRAPQAINGGSAADGCRRHGISLATFYKWKAL